MSSDPSQPALNLCPICKRQVEQRPAGNAKSCFPFCSERCKLIDLGRWLGGKYQIPIAREDQSDRPRESDR